MNTTETTVFFLINLCVHEMTESHHGRRMAIMHVIVRSVAHQIPAETACCATGIDDFPNRQNACGKNIKQVEMELSVLLICCAMDAAVVAQAACQLWTRATKNKTRENKESA